MTTAMDIATYIRNTWHPFSGEVQMHKILYYAQAWSLVWDGRPLFDERIEAWEKGPVVTSVRHQVPQRGPVVTLPESQKATIEAVLAYYGKFWGNDLIDLTHDEAPWKDAWAKRAVPNWCNEEITHDAMRRTYTQQGVAGIGPRRRPVAPQQSDRSRILARSSRAKREWGRTLALLAE